jgi:hypothetical protein
MGCASSRQIQGEPDSKVAPSQQEVAPSQQEVAPSQREVAPSQRKVALSQPKVAPSQPKIADASASMEDGIDDVEAYSDEEESPGPDATPERWFRNPVDITPPSKQRKNFITVGRSPIAEEPPSLTTTRGQVEDFDETESSPTEAQAAPKSHM